MPLTSSSYSSCSGSRQTISPVRSPAAETVGGELVVVAHQSRVGGAERDDDRARERREVDDPLRSQPDGVAQAVGQHEPALGVGVVDLDRFAVLSGDDVAGLDRTPAREVLGRTDDGHHASLGSPRRAIAATASTTAAPPDMSNFISAIFGPGLSEMPPLSNVTALPTSPSTGVFSPMALGAPPAERVVGS